MRELNTNLSPLSMREIDDTLQARNMFVGPDPVVLGRDTAFGDDGGGFHAYRA